MTVSEQHPKKKFPHINWVNTLFLAILTIASIVGTILVFMYSTITWPTWVLTACLTVAGGIGITAGYHRLFAHKTYTTSWPIQALLLLFGSVTFTGSVIEWAADHRNHHRYTDTKKDPYNIKQGFWYAHIGWILSRDYSKRDFSNVEDLEEKWLLRFQHRTNIVFGLSTGLLLPMAIASLWGEAWAGLAIAGGLRMVVAHHVIFCINSVCHVFGKSSYSNRISARDSWFTAILTFGEGYHNYHHQFPLDYRNGVRWFHFDPSKWLIFTLSKLGLASNLHRAPNYRIIQARVETYKLKNVDHSSQPLMEQLQESILQTIGFIREYEKAYTESHLKEHLLKLASAKKELAVSFSKWKGLCSQNPALA